MPKQVLLVRHAIALDRETPGVSDHLRPLTADGIKRFKKMARALGSLVTPDVVLTSPLLRAKQTAEILGKQWRGVAVQESEPLGTGSRGHFEDTLARLPASTIAAAVGHEPYLSEWAAEWLGSTRGGGFTFKKGGAALIEFSDEAAPDAGRLVFFLPPGVAKNLSA